jgi:hypothetical protein
LGLKRARVMGYGGVKKKSVINSDSKSNPQFSWFCDNPRLPRKHRGICGARTRRDTACQAPPVWNKASDKARNGRCKLNGGLSTGPKTDAGREAIRESNRKRKNISSD